MIKKEKGLTLTILIFTIVVMLILAGVIMNINTNLNKTVNLKSILINMQMIEAKASKINSEKVVSLNIDSLIVEDSDSETATKKYQYVDGLNLPGKHMEYKSGSEISDLIGKTNRVGQYLSNDANYYWYKFDKSNNEELKEVVGVDIDLEEKEVYIINYKTLEIAYGHTKDNGYLSGIENKFGEEIFFYKDLKKIKVDETKE